MRAPAGAPPLGRQIADLFAAGRHAELEGIARRMVTQAPGAAAGWTVLGAALAGQARHAEALAAKQQALQIAPDAQAHSNLATTLLALQRHEEAARHAAQAVTLDASLATAHGNLGFALEALGRPAEAVRCWSQALQRDAQLHRVRLRLAQRLQAQGELARAEALLTEGVRLREDDADAWQLLAAVLRARQRMAPAATAFHRALALQPANVAAWNDLGNTLHDLGRLPEAQAAFERAIALDGRLGAIHSNLGNVLREQGLLDEALACFRRAIALSPGFLGAHDNLLLALNYADAPTPEERLAEAHRYGAAAARLATPLPPAPPREPGPLRVGLVSGDLRNHPVGYFIESLLAALDPARVQVWAYANQQDEDDLTTRLRERLNWCRIDTLPDAEAAARIRADRIDVLLDLSGHTARNRLPLFCWRPAPVQASWLGYFATTGIAEIDYLLADAATVPVDSSERFSETVWRLPRTRLCFTPPARAPEVAPLPALTRGHVTFGSFQALAKVSDAVLALWGRVLAAVPGARLRLQSPQLGDEPTRDALRQRMRTQGLAPERVDLHGRSSRAAYLQAHAEVDLLLDTFPFPGGTTTCEALWMGVPTLTLRGDRLIARQGSGLLLAAGLPDWIADDEAGFVALAVQRASDLGALADLRAALRPRVAASALCDARAFAADFSEALEGMQRAAARRAP